MAAVIPAAAEAAPVCSPTKRARQREAARATEFEALLPYVLPYVALREMVNVKAVSRGVNSAAANHCAEHLTVVKSQIAGAGPCARVFSTYGPGLLSLTLHRVSFADRPSFANIISKCNNLRKLAVHDCDWTNWDDARAAEAISSLRQLQELRLQCNDLAAERNPFGAIMPVLRHLPQLRKLTIFSRLDAAGVENFAHYLLDHGASKRLIKVKLSTGLIASPAGAEVLHAIAQHASLQKLTIVRPDGMGEPLRKAHCSLIGQAIFHNKSITALHLRRCGMWTDTLASLVPPGPCPHMRRLKLDGNSLGYLSGSYFNEAMDALLSRMPNLTALHLGNNQLDGRQAEGLAASLLRHRMNKIENLTMGSNDIGDAGLMAILKALPPGMKQLYLHGIDCTDQGLLALRDALDRWNELWGLGLNGNPITDSGARTLARALRNRASLRDVGITLSEMTDAGCLRLATALGTCKNLRYVYLYTSGFKAAQKVTEDAKSRLRKALPPHATAAFDHRLSRYLKKP